MDDQGSSGLEMDGKGSLDVDAELSSIDKLKNLGMETEGMEELLFTDINEYKRRKLELLRHEISKGVLDSDPYAENDIDGSVDLLDIIENNDIPEEPQIDNYDDDLLLLDLSIDNESIDDEQISEGSDVVDIPETEEPINDISIAGTIDRSVEHPIDTVGSEPDPNGQDFEEETFEDHAIGSKLIHGPIKGNRGLLIASISVLLVISIIGIYMGYSIMDNGSDDTEEFIPVMDVSDLNPLAGSIVELNGFPEGENGLQYKWSINPGYFTILSGSLEERQITFFFKQPASYDLSLTITRGSLSETTSSNIQVQPAEITLERERFHDSAEYDVEGHVRLDHIDRMVNSKDLMAYKTYDTDFWTTETDPMSTSISNGVIDSLDGLGNSYSHIQRSTTESLKMSGYLETEAGYRSTITGSTYLDQISYVDIYTKRPTSLISDIDYDFSIQAFTGANFKYITSEKVWTYPSLEDSFAELSIEDISPERNITFGDSGSTLWGSYDLNWRTDHYDIIMGVTSLKLDLSLDADTMNRLSLTEMEMSIWIGDGVPQIMKMVLNISSERNIQTPYVLDYSQEMSSYSKGENVIIFGNIQHQHGSITRINEVYSDIGEQFHSNWEMVPAFGTMYSSIPEDFTAEDALDKFTDNLNYRNFERQREDPFALISNFTIKLDKDQWKFSIGDSGDDRCWNQTVLRETNPPGLTSRLNPVMVTRDDIGEILTYSGGEVALKRTLSSVNREGAIAIFGVSNIPVEMDIDLERFSIGTMADMPHPIVGFVNPTLGEKIDYGMFISSSDGRIEAVLDMTSGQLSYVRITT